MKFAAALLLSSLPVAFGVGGVTFFADNGVFYICGEQLEAINMCDPPGDIKYYKHLDEDGPICDAMEELEDENDEEVFGSPAPEYVDDTDGPVAQGYILTYTEYKGHQGFRCTRNGCTECHIKGNPSQSGGDPHFRTFDGTEYSYHGECDLVMARSPSFANGLGMDLHIRTKGMGSWSLISNAVVRIGDDTFEMTNEGVHYINGKTNQPIPKKLAGRFQVTKERKVVERKNEDGTTVTFDKTIAIVNLEHGREIRFTRIGKGIMYVKMQLYLSDTEGMMGVHGKPGLIGRGGVVLSNGDEMGEHWQVNGTEPMLFREARAPQWPAKCIPPSLNAQQRRLRMSEMEVKQAQEICAPVEEEQRRFCVEDVLLSGDASSADGYLFGEAF